MAVGSWADAVGSSGIGGPDGVLVGRGAAGVSLLTRAVEDGDGDVGLVTSAGVVDMLRLSGVVEVVTSSGVVVAASLLVVKKSPKEVSVGMVLVVGSDMMIESALVKPTVCVTVMVT